LKIFEIGKESDIFRPYYDVLMPEPTIEKDDLLAEEQSWLKMMASGDQKAMELIFHRYYKYLVVTAYNYLNDNDRAKDLVQDVFFKFWEKRGSLSIDTSLKAFLRRSVVNRSIDELRKKKIKWEEEVSDTNAPIATNNIDRQLETSELEKVIHHAIDTLPEKCKLVFSLSRFEDMSHAEISEALGISKKTIENQMTKALKVLRAAVDAYKGVIGMLFLLFDKYL